MTATVTARAKQSKIQKLEPAKKVLLHHAILRYLEQNAFSKTFKRFLSEAQIENDDWKASSVDLEAIYCKYIDACPSDANSKTSKELDLNVDEQVTKKKKKKTSNEGKSDAVVDQSQAIDKKLHESAKNSGESLVDTKITESEAKPKETKKRRKDLDTCDQTEEVTLNKPVVDSANKLDTDELPKNTKNKRKNKKKKDKPLADALVEVVDAEDTVNANTGTEEVQPSADTTKKEKKSSKKRKRLASDEKEDQSTKMSHSQASTSETSPRMYTEHEVADIMSQVNLISKVVTAHTAPLYEALARHGLISLPTPPPPPPAPNAMGDSNDADNDDEEDDDEDDGSKAP